MTPFLKKLIKNAVLRYKPESVKGSYSSYAFAKGYRELKISLKNHLKDAFLITLGIFSASFGFKGFLLTNDFIDGGATGISLLLSALTQVPFYILIVLVNIPFVILAYVVMGQQFAFKTALAIAGLSLCLATVTFPDVTRDNFLVALFGGFFLGAGIGMAVRGGAVIDGTEVLAIYITRKVPATLGDVVLVINVMIFSAAAYLLGIEIALYSMITYLAASRTLDFIVEGIEEYIGVTIVSTHSEEIRQMVIHNLGRGLTIYTGGKGYGKRGDAIQTEILFTVITRLELNRLKTEIEKIDPHAFVAMTSVKDTVGGMIKKRRLPH